MKTFLLILLIMFLGCTVSADTVVLKDGEKIKGLILKDYKDRILLSTADGEKTLMKADLKAAIYDSEVDALFKRALNYEKRDKLFKAYYTYEKVLEMDPEMFSAKNRMIYLENRLGKKLKDRFYDKFYRKRTNVEDEDPEKLSLKLFDEVGFSLKEEEPHPVIDLLNPDKMSKDKIDFYAKDKIISVWGQITAYMDVNEVAGMLLEPGEVKLTIEREYSVPIPPEPFLSRNPFKPVLSRLLGATILLKKTGFIVAKTEVNGPFHETGIKNGDMICFIDGNDVNFMPYTEIQKLIVDSMGNEAIFVVQRDISFWKKENN